MKALELTSSANASQPSTGRARPRQMTPSMSRHTTNDTAIAV